MVILALFCCALWGSAFPCVKLGYAWFQITATGSKILFAGYRFFLAGMMTFAAGCFIEKHILSVKRNMVPHVMWIGFLQTTVEYVCFYIGMSYVTGTKGSILEGTSTFFAILLAHFIIRGERLSIWKILGCIVGFSGVLMVNAGGMGGGFTFLGDGMVILSAAAYGASSTLTKLFTDRVTPMALTAYQLMFGGALLILIGFAAGGSVTVYDMRSAVLLAYMAGISFAGFSIWTALLKYNPVGKVAIFGFTIPVFGVMLSGLMLGENIFTLVNIMALLCVSAGIVMVNRTKETGHEGGSFLR